MDAGLIVRVGPPTRQPDVVLPGSILVPGFVNAHSHAFQRAFRGRVQWKRAGRDDFWSWRERMYATANSLDPDGVEAVSRLAFLEMAEAGITRVGEFHYLHHQPDGTPYADPDELARRVIAAALDVGVRICLLRVVYGRGGPGRPLEDHQRRFGDVDAGAALDAVGRLSGHPDGRVSVGLAPHSVRAVPPAWIPELATWQGVVHAHVSEQPAENEACRAEQGMSPTQALAPFISARFTAVHLTHPEDGDVDVLAAADASVCVCPSTELDLGDGFLPLDARRLRLCVGSDSQARIDVLDEVRALEMHARGLARARNVMAPPDEEHGLAERLLRIASDGRPLGAGEGRIAVGEPADLVAIDIDHPGAWDVPPLEAVVFGATPSHVREVWVAGRHLVSEGRHLRRSALAPPVR